MASLLQELRQNAQARQSADQSDQTITAFLVRGESVKAWAKSRNFHPELVYSVLRGQRKCLRGQSFLIAKELGMK